MTDNELIEQLFLVQLEWDEMPSQEYPEEIYDATQQSLIDLNELFTISKCKDLQNRVKQADVNSMVLLGQFFYIQPKKELGEKFCIISGETHFENGTVECYEPNHSACYNPHENIFDIRNRCADPYGIGYNAEDAVQGISRLHRESAVCFDKAYELNSPLAMYYLAKLWETAHQKNTTPEEIKKKFDSLWACGEICESKSHVKTEILHIVKSLISNICLNRANKRVMNEKQQTEELMQWVAHSTNSDLTSLELAVDREHAVNSQVLTRKIRQDVETFSLMSSDSEAFIDAVKRDITGTTTLNDLICKSVISTMLFMLSPKARDQKLMNHRYFDYAQSYLNLSSEVKRKDWVKSSEFPTMQKELFIRFLSLQEDYSALLSWIADHFGKVFIDIDKDVHIQMSDHGKKAAVLSYIMTQFINNTMKYGVADCKGSLLSIKCGTDAEDYILTCSNMDMQSKIRKGNNKGLQAMNLMLSKLKQAPIEIKKEMDRFEVTCRLSKVLMGE